MISYATHRLDRILALNSKGRRPRSGRNSLHPYDIERFGGTALNLAKFNRFPDPRHKFVTRFGIRELA